MPLGHWELSPGCPGSQPSSPQLLTGPSWRWAGGGLRPGVRFQARPPLHPTSPGPACPLQAVQPRLITLLQASMPYLPNPGSPSNSRPSQRPPKDPEMPSMTQRCPPLNSWTPWDPETPQDSETSPRPRYLPVSPGLETSPRTQEIPYGSQDMDQRIPQDPKNSPGQVRASGSGVLATSITQGLWGW